MDDQVKSRRKHDTHEVVDKPNSHDDFKQAQLAGGWIPGMDPKVDYAQHFEFGGSLGTLALMTGFPLLMWYMWIGATYYDGKLPLPQNGESWAVFGSICVILFTPVRSHTSGPGASTGHSTSLRQHATSTCLDSRAMGSVFSIYKASDWSIIAQPTVACTSQLPLWPLSTTLDFSRFTLSWMSLVL